MEAIIPIAIYFFSINLIEFILMGIDKVRARRNKWRVPEATLFLFTIFGGSIGGILGMNIFRHKTQKPTFYIGYPVILLCQIVLTLYFLFLSPFSFKIM